MYIFYIKAAKINMVCMKMFYNGLYSYYVYVHQPSCTLNLAAVCFMQ